MVSITLGVCAATASADITIPFFMGVGDLPGGSVGSNVKGVSADGSVVVGQSKSANGMEAYRWSRSTGMVGLGDLPTGPFDSEGYAVSADGSVIAGQGKVRVGIVDVTRAAVWSSGGAPQPIGPFPGASSDAYTVARGVSADGSVVVGYGPSPRGSQEAFRWTAAGGMEPLGFIAGLSFFSSASGVSGDGNTVVGSSKNHAFRWTRATGMVEIAPEAGASFTLGAGAASFDGSVVVGASSLTSTGTEAFRWTASGGTVGLGWLPYSGSAPDCSANAMSADGSIVVGMSSNKPFIWDQARGIRDLRVVLTTEYGLDLTGWALNSVTISADGRTFGGHGQSPSGATEGWVATIPAPVTVAPLAVLALASRRRR